MSDVLKRALELRTVEMTKEQFEMYQDLVHYATSLESFYNYFSELYGQGLEIANWHQNGELEPFDNFFDSAEQEMEESK